MKYTKIFKEIAEKIIEIIFPNTCIACRDVLEYGRDKWLCPKCRGEIKPISGNVCKVCGVPVKVGDICARCRNTEFYFKRAYCAYEYKDKVRKAIHNIKFNNCLNYVYYFVDKASEYALEQGLKPPYIIVSVPMHKSKLRKRGYNQSAAFAKALAKYGLGQYKDVLVKVKNTKNQHDIKDEKERKKNLKNVFEVKDPSMVKDKRVLLVDDIFTTGSTANECSKALVKAGAAEVEVLCISVVKKED